MLLVSWTFGQAVKVTVLVRLDDMGSNPFGTTFLFSFFFLFHFFHCFKGAGEPNLI